MNKGLMASFTNKHHMMMRHLLKKHRKTRTAFTNEQLVQLEKKFKLQKYLTPADRDEIASTLKLSNSQVGLFAVLKTSKTTSLLFYEIFLYFYNILTKKL